MRILIVGVGGVGGYLGARMIQKDQQVAFLLRPRTADVVRLSGIKLRSPLGNWDGLVEIAGPQSGTFDLVILSCKAFDLDAAMQDIRPFLHAGTFILPLLNGIQHVERMATTLPDAKILGGVAHIGASTEGPGYIVHLNTVATFLAGPLRGGPPVSNDIQRLFAAISGTEIVTQIVDDASAQMWTKLVFLATLAASTCLHDADVGTILASVDGRAVILGTLEEARSIAALEGFDPPSDDLDRYRTQLTEKGSKATASMLRDIRASRPTEVEHILGDLVSRAIGHKIETPNLVAALWHVRAYEKGRPER
ncbi:MAG: 2-dehydropantoate 2-reductase [Litoreibacter sp.]